MVSAVLWSILVSAALSSYLSFVVLWSYFLLTVLSFFSLWAQLYFGPVCVFSSTLVSFVCSEVLWSNFMSAVLWPILCQLFLVSFLCSAVLWSTMRVYYIDLSANDVFLNQSKQCTDITVLLWWYIDQPTVFCFVAYYSCLPVLMIDLWGNIFHHIQ